MVSFLLTNSSLVLEVYPIKFVKKLLIEHLLSLISIMKVKSQLSSLKQYLTALNTQKLQVVNLQLTMFLWLSFPVLVISTQMEESVMKNGETTTLQFQLKSRVTILSSSLCQQHGDSENKVCQNYSVKINLKSTLSI